MKVFSSAASEIRRSYSAWDDDALVLALEASDEKALSEIYERSWLRLYKLTHHKLRSRSNSDKVVKDLFVALWQKRATKKGPHYYFSLVFRSIGLFHTPLPFLPTFIPTKPIPTL